jgi:alginate O-acetyltransferase complex protein AlgI
MLFNSLQFLLFFVVVTGLYFSLRLNGRWRLLLVASCYFYMVFQPAYLLILALTIVIDYGAGLWIERTGTPGGNNPARKWLLILSIITNIGILAFFKYLAFFTQNVTWLFDHLSLPGVAASLESVSNRLFIKVLRFFGESGVQSFKDNMSILPIGLSFHTFQAMSYTIEVYRGNQKAERHFGIYALYVMFYPQLVAGPIERPQNVLHQFHTYFPYDFENVKAGLMRMAFGFFKKVVIADRLAMVVAPAFADPSQHNGLTLLVATFFFTFQIYCDFSGYSDIAIGAARVMGFSLMENFRTPYVATSIADFWRRWHISLSTWFRDYLYIPLGGNRHGEFRKNLNLMLVFMASGLWHGANWTYVIWGGLNGLYQILATVRDRLLGNRQPTQATQRAGLPALPQPVANALNIGTTFVLIMLTWVFFRARSVSDALLILRKIATLSPADPVVSPLNATEMGFSLALIAFLLVKEQYYPTIQTQNTARFYVLIALIAFVTWFFGVFTSSQFIYFQF